MGVDPGELALDHETRTRALRWLTRTLGVAEDNCQLIGARSRNIVFRVEAADGLSIHAKIGRELTAEYSRLTWLADHVQVPAVAGFETRGQLDMLLTTTLPGVPLNDPTMMIDPPATARIIGAALRTFHAADTSRCPFGQRQPGAVLTHGDACLPNIIADNGTLTGFIDVGDAGLGRREIDLAAALWSIGYCFGHEYYDHFFNAYGMQPPPTAEVHRLRRGFWPLSDPYLPRRSGIPHS